MQFYEQFFCHLLLRAAVGSPQYQQAVQAFQEALESGQLAPVLQQFNLPENAIKAAATGDVKAFAEAMESSSKKDEAPYIIVV